MKTVLLISGKVLHYRVSVYNYMWRRFQECGWNFEVLTNRLQPENQRPLRFRLQEVPFKFGTYRKLVNGIKPDAVIVFLHLKEPIFWPLIHWLKLKGIPIVFWTKGANLDEPESRLRFHLFNYVHSLSSSLILYSAGQLDCLKPVNRAKAIPANNTINFEDIPTISESRDEIKKEFNLPFEKFVLFAGTMGLNGERKKVDHLIEVFRRIDHDRYGVVIVGAGMPEATRAKLNPKNTRYLGALNDPQDLQISKLFKAADLFVVPGHIGLGLNQAFHWGLPVVTEHGLQPPEIHLLKSGRNGFMVPQDDVAELHAKIMLLMGNDAMRSEFSKNAQEDVQREASIENMFRGFSKAVEVALSSHRLTRNSGLHAASPEVVEQKNYI